MMIDILQAARYLIYLAHNGREQPITHLKLQKLLYLAQGWSFVWDNKALFEDEFEAWQYGPVNLKIYEYFRKYGREIIPALEGNYEIIDSEAKTTLDAIWREFSKYSAFSLVELTHAQTPWKNADYYHQSIKTEDIKNYFQSTYL